MLRYKGPGALSCLCGLAMQIADGLNLFAIHDRPWQIQPCSAKSGDGLRDGMEWLVKQVK